MADFGKFTGTATWKRGGRGRRSFKLDNSSGTIATLRFRRALSSLGEAKARDGEWMFKRVGFLRPRVSVRDAGSDADIGEASKGTPVALFACLGYYLTVLAAEEDATTSTMMTMG